MRNIIPTPGPISWGRRLMPAAAVLGLLLMFGFAQTGLAQSGTNPLFLTDTYFVTGDYVVGGWVKGPSDGTFATGTLTIPDPLQPNSKAVPPGADIVAAFLYWETVESTNTGAQTGKQGFFNGYPITGMFLPSQTPNAPTSWSAGGCSGNSDGSKTIQGYRADVRPYLPVDANGKFQGNGAFQVKLADTGTNGHAVPFTLGATLVIIYRVQSALEPLNAIILYDGIFAPSNATPNMGEMIQRIVGFYQPAASPMAKITHIVGGGQPKKDETVLLNGVALPSLYSDPLDPLPGIYNLSWDNPTWDVSALVKGGVTGFDTSETTSVVPTGTNGNCLDWGAVVFSSTVPDPDGDGLLHIWKVNQGYTDALSGQWVSLPGATLGQKDLFVEIDYASNLDGSAGPYLHSHLPKQDALDKVGNALKNENPSVHAHFDLGPGIYQGDPYVISYPVPAPPAGVPTFPGAGGNAISEGLLVCKEMPTLCQFPNQATVGWKEGFLIVRNTEPNPASTPPVPLMGNFQPGRSLSYHYVLFGHALGSPRTYWPAAGVGPALAGSGIATLVSIVVSNNVGTVTLLTPPLLLKPGDACSVSDVCDRVTVGGTLQAHNAALNGSYKFLSAPSSVFDGTKFTTTFTIQTSGVANGTYDFSSEPQLGLAFGGPTSASGYSDVGGGDTAVMFGLWPANDAPGCQAVPGPSGFVTGHLYCTNQVGTVTAQAGTLLHELGHTNFLTHGGTFFPAPGNPNGTVVTSGALAGQQANNPPFFAPVYGLNCNPGFLSTMNYLFQIRGFPDGGIGYSGQTLPSLSETALNESLGIGLDLFTNQLAVHFTRWYAPPNAGDIQLQNTTGTRFASIHCDGSPVKRDAFGNILEPAAVRVEGSTITEPGGFSGPIDWNNDLIVPDLTEPVAWQDVNFNGSTLGSPDPPVSTPLLPKFNDMQGFNDLVNFDLRQIGARASSFALSGGGGNLFPPGGGNVFAPGGGNLFPPGGGNVFAPGGGNLYSAGGGNLFPPGGGNLFTPGGGNLYAGGGGTEQDLETACSTADPPTGLMAALGSKSVVLNWTPPELCQVVQYDIWRAVGSFSTLASVLANITSFDRIKELTGTPPTTTFTDTNVKNNTTYTYFVTDTNKQGALSGPSEPATVFVFF